MEFLANFVWGAQFAQLLLLDQPQPPRFCRKIANSAATRSGTHTHTHMPWAKFKCGCHCIALPARLARSAFVLHKSEQKRSKIESNFGNGGQWQWQSYWQWHCAPRIPHIHTHTCIVSPACATQYATLFVLILHLARLQSQINHRKKAKKKTINHQFGNFLSLSVCVFN